MVNFIGNMLLQYENIKSSTMEECIKYCKSKKILGLDIETGRLYPKNKYREDVYKPGLDPHMTRIMMVQIGDLEQRFVIDARVIDLTPLIEILENPDILKVGQNLKFEGKFFFKYYGCRIVNVHDCMIVEKLLYNGLRKSNSLSAMMYRYLGIKPIQNINLFSDTFTNVSKKAKHRQNEYILSGIRRDIEEIEAELEQEMLDNEYIDKSTRMGFIELGDAPFTLKMIKYGDEDITAPLKIYKKQLEGVDGWYPSNAINIENKFTQVLAEIEVRGMHFDQQVWLNIYNDAITLYRKRLDKLNIYVEENYQSFTGSGDLFTLKPVCAIKWTSSKQVIAFLKSLDWCPKEVSKSTGKLSYTVGAKTLFRELINDNKTAFYKQKDPDAIIDKQTFILAYLLFKKSEQAITTFGKEWLKYVHPITKRVHCNYNQLMNTTRPSTNNPNLLNIPGGEYRKAFTAPKNWNVVNCDYSGQELRVAAQVHKVQKMIDFFAIGDPTFGDDFHSFSATQMFRVLYNDPELIINKKDHSEERNKAKNITFKLNYGGSSYTLAKDLGITEEEADKYVENYFKGLPGMEKSFEKKKKIACEIGYIVLSDVTQARYYYPYFKEMQELHDFAMSFYPDNYRSLTAVEKQTIKNNIRSSTGPVWKKYFYYKSKLERRALNFPIQGAAAQMMKLACIYIYNWRWVKKERQEGCFLNNVIYDETNSEAKQELAEEYARIVEKAMVKAGSVICNKVPFVAEAVVSEHWTH